MVQGTESSVELNFLNSLTEYQVAVFAVYHSSASEALRGSATTRKFLQKCLSGGFNCVGKTPNRCLHFFVWWMKNRNQFKQSHNLETAEEEELVNSDLTISLDWILNCEV